jgi:hypothetical protein
VCAVPETAREVLALEAGRARLASALDRGKGTGRAVAAYAQRLAPYLVASDACEQWEDLTPWERADWIDAHWPIEWWLDLAGALIDEASLTTYTLERVREYLDLELGGGCECRLCESEDMTSTPALEAQCLRAQVPGYVVSLTHAWLPMRADPSMDAPWWCHQMRGVWAAAEGKIRQEEVEARREERERLDEQARIRKKLAQYGGVI